MLGATLSDCQVPSHYNSAIVDTKTLKLTSPYLTKPSTQKHGILADKGIPQIQYEDA